MLSVSPYRFKSFFLIHSMTGRLLCTVKVFIIDDCQKNMDSSKCYTHGKLLVIMKCMLLKKKAE